MNEALLAHAEFALIEPMALGDKYKLFFESLNLGWINVQDNLRRRVKDILRDLYSQIRQSFGRLVRLVLDKVLYVNVDLHQCSKAFDRRVPAMIAAKDAEGKIQDDAERVA
ncbi:dTDP-4-dehydrorhamnose 3,5-epimerase [Azoarcus sp. Aa7]|nr:dTDP-4-dehydrorhamnose 3,5-epimerase [Azoarcus sp. Aa7]